jgi:hypothetical protein
MQRLKPIVVALVAIAAMSAVASATASAALPQFKWAGTKKGFTSTQEGSGTLESTSSLAPKVSCTGGTSSGEVEGVSPSKNVTNVIVKFTGCTASGGKCGTATAASGEITTVKLVGVLGYINTKSTPKEVGLLLHPKEGTKFTSFKCEGNSFTNNVTGEVIGKMTPVNEATTHFKLTFTQTKGVQGVQSFEGETTKHHLTGEVFGITAESAEESIQNVTTEETTTLEA